MSKVGRGKSTKNWFSSRRLLWCLSRPKVWQGWASLVGALVIGAAPLVYLSTVYNGDTYCRQVIQKGLETSCDPNLTNSMYMLGSLLWLGAWVLILIQIGISMGEKPEHKVGKTTEHADKS